MKTIFISSFHSLISRNILTPILPKLAQEDLRVVLLVPTKKTEYFKKTFGSSNIIVEGVSIPKKRFEDLIYSWSISLVGVQNHVVDDWKKEKRYLKYYTAHIFHTLFSHFFFLHHSFRSVSNIYLRTNVFDSLFEKYRPDIVFSTDSFDRADRALLIESNQKGLHTVGMIRSWDNATTKGVFIAEPSHTIVPNEVLKEEMVSIHHVSPDKVTVTGVPHYDEVSKQSTITRENFIKGLGLDPTKKTILFAPGGRVLYKHDGEILILLKKLIDTNRLITPVQFLVRCPPGDTIDTSPVSGDHNFVIDTPGVNLTGRKKENEMTDQDNEHLNDSLRHSDIILTVVSTVTIDGTVFNKPVIVFGFNPTMGLSDDIKKFSKNTHFKKLLDSGMITVSYSEDELVLQINTFLKNPDYNKLQREKVIERYAHKLDRASSDRLLTVLLQYLS